MHMCKHNRADHSSLILLKNKKTKPEQRVTYVCSGKQSVNVTRSTGTDADCSYMDKNSQCNIIVYVRKNNYTEGSGSATIKITQPIPSNKRKRKPRRTETT